MSDSAAQHKSILINALVLAFASSRMKSVIPPDALRSVLEVQWVDLFTDDQFDLQEVWELFEHQVNFDAKEAVAPMCRFKSWEQRLQVPIRMPNQLQGLSALEITENAAGCMVGQHQIDKVFAGLGKKVVTIAPVLGVDAKQREGRPAILAALVVVALGTLVFSGISLYKGCDTAPKWVDETKLVTEIPLKNVQRLGPDVTATLADPAWLKIDIETRRKQVAATLNTLKSDGVRAFVIVNENGKQAVVAVTVGSKRVVKVTFR